MREAQHKRAEAAHVASLKDASNNNNNNDGTASTSTDTSTTKPAPRVDLTAAQASVQAAGQKAGAYISSWGAWASERRKGWAEQRASARSEDVGAAAGAGEKSPGKMARWNSSVAGGGGGGGGKMKEEKGGDGIGRLDA